MNRFRTQLFIYFLRNDVDKNKIIDDDDDDNVIIEEENKAEENDDEEVIEEESNDKVVNEIDDLYVLDDESDEVKQPPKRIFGNFDENEDEDGYVKDARKAFFENEAELSGSEVESDANFEDESNDEELVYSGDEDLGLPSDGELKDELANIYLYVASIL